MLKRDSGRFTLLELPGFPEIDINEEIVFNKIIKKIKKIYETYGFSPLETRLVEIEQLLKKKGIENKEIYCLNKIFNDEVSTGSDERKLALRFDLTLPLSRYIGQYKQRLSFPFKRYQIQKVYRGEDAKKTKGRFNEFYQADIDIVGKDKLDMAYDGELPCLIYTIFREVFKVDNFIIKINNRKLLEGIFIQFSQNKETNIKKLQSNIKKAIKIIDDLEKVPIEKIYERLEQINISGEIATQFFSLSKILFENHPLESIKILKNKFNESDVNQNIIKGIEELEEVFNSMVLHNIDQKYFKLDLNIARGLDYYTGTVYETIIPELSDLGSVCSGGRYNDLVRTLTGDSNDNYPGVGISIGLSRLIPSLIINGYLNADKKTVTQILITCQSKQNINDYQKIGKLLREAKFKVDIYLNKTTKLFKQLDYANINNIPYVIIANKNEIEREVVIVRDMLSSSQQEVKNDEIIEYFNSKLNF